MVKERKRITGSTNIDRPNHYTDQIKPKLPHFNTLKPTNFNQANPSFTSNSSNEDNRANNLTNEDSIQRFSYSENKLNSRPGWKSITQSHLSKEPVIIKVEIRQKQRHEREAVKSDYENDYDSDDVDESLSHHFINNTRTGMDIGNHFSSSVAAQTYVLPSISFNTEDPTDNASGTNNNMSTSKILSNLLVKSNSKKNKLDSGKYASNNDATDIPIINQITSKLRSLELSSNSPICDNSYGASDNNSLTQSNDSIVLKQLMNHDFKKATRMDNICNLSTNQLNKIIVLQKVFDQNEMKKEAEREEENLYLSRQFLNTIDVEQQQPLSSSSPDSNADIAYITTSAAAASIGRVNTAMRKHKKNHNLDSSSNITLSSTSYHAEYESFKASHHLSTPSTPIAESIATNNPDKYESSLTSASVSAGVALATLVPKPNQKLVIVVPSRTITSSSSSFTPPQQQLSLTSSEYDNSSNNNNRNDNITIAVVNNNSRPSSKTTIVKNTFGNNNSLDTLNSNNIETLKNTLNINDTPFGPSRIKSLQYLEKRAIALDKFLKNNNHDNNANNTKNTGSAVVDHKKDIDNHSEERFNEHQYNDSSTTSVAEFRNNHNNDNNFLSQLLNKSKSATNLNNGTNNMDILKKNKSMIMRPSTFNNGSSSNNNSSSSVVNNNDFDYDDYDESNNNYYDDSISFRTGKKFFAQPQPYLSKYKLNTVSTDRKNRNNNDDDAFNNNDNNNNHYQSMASLYTNGLTLSYTENNKHIDNNNSTNNKSFNPSQSLSSSSFVVIDRNSNNINNTSDAHRACTAKQSLRDGRYARTQRTLQQLKEFNDQEELKKQIIDMSRVRRKNNTMIRVETKALIDNFLAFSRVPVQGRKNVLKPNKHLSDRMWNGQGNAAMATDTNGIHRNRSSTQSNASNSNYDQGDGSNHDSSSINSSPFRQTVTRAAISKDGSGSGGGFETTYNQSFDSSILLSPLPSASPFAPPLLRS